MAKYCLDGLGWLKRENKRLHMSLLEVENLRTYFKTEAGEARAVDGVSFEVGDGRRLAAMLRCRSAILVSTFSAWASNSLPATVRR